MSAIGRIDTTYQEILRARTRRSVREARRLEFESRRLADRQFFSWTETNITKINRATGVPKRSTILSAHGEYSPSPKFRCKRWSTWKLRTRGKRSGLSARNSRAG